MKPLLALCCLFITSACAAQQVNIPYRSGKVFGLCDEKGKVLLRPQFDHVSWMEGSWFSTGNELLFNDTLKRPGGNLIRHSISGNTTGLLHAGKVVLRDEPFEKYVIIADRCILARYEDRSNRLTQAQFDKYGEHRRFFSLFNEQGTNLFPENFLRLGLYDSAGTSSKRPNACRYLLFAAQHFNERYSLFVFDADAQQISEWMMKDAVSVESDAAANTPGRLAFRVKDAEGRTTSRLIDYSGGKFVFKEGNTAEAAPSVTPKPRPLPPVRTELPEYTIASDVDALVAVPPDVPARQRTGPPAFEPYFLRVRDSLYWMTGRDKMEPVLLARGSRFILEQPQGMVQSRPVIVQSGGHYYIAASSRPGPTAYDSLLYFGRYFLAWKTVGGKQQAGVLYGADSVVVPFDYDSLVADIRLLSIISDYRAGRSSLRIGFKEASEKYVSGSSTPYSRELSYRLTAWRGGRCGVVTLNGKTLVPLEYELIANNNISGTSQLTKGDFLVLKKAGRYGMGRLTFNASLNQERLEVFVEPRLEYVPTYYYPDYYGVKGFLLIGLSSDDMTFKGFAGKDGTAYYKD